MKTITLEITEEDYKLLIHEIIDPEAWIKNAISGKVNSIKKRLIPVVVNKMINDDNVISIPANKNEICNYEFSKPDYKNAAERKEAQENQ